MRTETRGASASDILTSLKSGKKPPKEKEPHQEDEATHQEQVPGSQHGEEPQAQPTAGQDAQENGLKDQAPHHEQVMADLQVQPEAVADQAAPTSEQPSSIEPILDKKPLAARIKEALALVDRVRSNRLCEELSVPIPEFNAAINKLVEAKEIREDAISTPPVLFLPLSDEERKAHKEKLATARSNDKFLALEWIHAHRTYREDYGSWDDFLWHELGHTHDWWETEKRRMRIQQVMDQRAVKMKIPLNKELAKHLDKVRDEAELFVSCVSEFQALPHTSQIAKRLGEIVQRHLDRKSKLSSLRQFVPDATEQEFAALAPIYAADQRWRNWYPEHTTKLEERVQASGRPKRDCVLEVAQESKALPTEKVLLSAARGAELEPLVNDLKRMLGPWEREQKNKAEIDEWQRQGRRLGIYNPQGEQADTTTPTAPPKPKPQQPDPYFPEDEGEKGGNEPEKKAVLYNVDLSGDFRLWAQDGNQAIGQDDLTKLLQSLVKSLSDGTEVTQPSSITVRPAVPKEQSA